MGKKGLERKVKQQGGLSELDVLNKYFSYINGDIPDEYGEIGKKISSDADTLSEILGYESTKAWINSFKNPLNTLEGRFISQDNINSIQETYKKVESLGKSLRELNQAISIIESFEMNLFPNVTSGAYFLKGYRDKLKIVSNFKKNCLKRLKSYK